MPIRRLDPSLVNKIAAGEVIERPASVVKELVENAIDAGAGRIDVTLEAGGIDLIRVTDDGRGIGRDELPLAVAPHATSKICDADDLFNIQTLGFRGEALASIASVSHLRMLSRPHDQDEGWEIVPGEEDGWDGASGKVTAASSNMNIAPGDVEAASRNVNAVPSDRHGASLSNQSPDRQITRSPDPRPHPAPPGTTVEVRNLFFNVPARRKFLKQPQTECSHVTEQIARLSLAHPGVAFHLTHNGRTMRSLPAAAGRRSRIADFYGAELAECLLPVRSEERGLLIEGLIAPPAQSRASTKWQYLFLNGRFITDRRIAYSIREAFRGLIEHDRYPVVFLFLTADPRDFDVNVHPTKIEVRWKDAGLVQSQVLGVLRETLLSHDLTPAMHLNRAAGGFGNVAGGGMAASGGAGRWAEGRLEGAGADPQRARIALADYLKRVDPTQTRLAFTPPPFRSEALRPSIAGTLRPPEAPRDAPAAPDVAETRGVTADAPPQAEEPGAARNDPPAIRAAGAAPADAAALIAPPPGGVMQIHNTYLVAQTEDGVIIIDQHALHERILYERFRERILQGPLESQRLLLPEPLGASPTRIETAAQYADLLARLGIEVEPFGPGTLAVQAFPTLLRNVRMGEFTADLLDKLAESDGAASEETAIHAALDMMACKAAVKAGDPLTQDEMLALLEMRHLTERSSNCPHGRPTTLELTTRDLEKQFKRA